MRAVGSGHSFTEIALTDGVAVDLGRLDRVLSVDRPAGLVKVEAGIVLAALNRRLDALGLAFENLGDIDRQTLAGSISTGTHGTGARFRSVSAQVEAIDLVLADGSSLEISAASDPAALAAARIGLGALGLIYAVTIRTVPAFTLHRTDVPRPLDETLATLDELNAGHDHFEFYVFPHTRTALCRESRRTDEPPSPRPRAVVYAQEVMLENWVGQLFALAGRHLPSQVPRLARLAAAGVGRSTKVDRSYRVFASERRIRFTEMEYGIPREHAAEAVRRVLQVAGAPGAPGRLPDRGPLRGRRRPHPQRLPRPRHVLRRRASGPQARLAALLPRGRADHGLLRRAPALGQAPLPDRRDARAALPALVGVPSAARGARSRGPVRERVRPARARRRHRRKGKCILTVSGH